MIPDELRKFFAPEFVFGVGARALAGRYVRNLGVERVLVVTDPGVMAAGWTGEVVDSLEAAGVVATVFSAVTPNPRFEEVMAGAARYREAHCVGLVAVGGGSPMDCAKGIGIVTSNERHIGEFEGVDRVPRAMPPLVCVPTTAGTSADVSQFAIFADLERAVKIAVISKAVVPDVALIDPDTLTTVDHDLAACTGLDALTHAVEAYVSNASSPITDLHALEAIRLLARFLVPSLGAPGELELRGQVMRASLHAGLAFSNASLGLVHAMAHALGGLLDLAHGECNALLLEHVVEFNFPATPERYARIAEALGMALGPDGRCQPTELIDRLRGLRVAAGVDRSLAALGVGSDDLPRLADVALHDPCAATNPREPRLADIEEIYGRAI